MGEPTSSQSAPKRILLLGDSTKARTKLGWNPQTSFEQLVDMMVECDLELASQEKALAERETRVRRAA
jgi:hypothetical protein